MRHHLALLLALCLPAVSVPASDLAGDGGSARREGPGAQSALDAVRARARAGDFDAVAAITCAMSPQDGLGACEAQVARSPGGTAALLVVFRNGVRRLLFFENGTFVSANATMAGAGRDVSGGLAGGTYRIGVDGQSFEFPAGLITGP